MADVATCRHCSQQIERQAREFWRHRQNQQQRCMPGTRNAQMANPAPGSVKPV